jgi:hypothetical protein
MAHLPQRGQARRTAPATGQRPRRIYQIRQAVIAKSRRILNVAVHAPGEAVGMTIANRTHPMC